MLVFFGYNAKLLIIPATRACPRQPASQPQPACVWHLLLMRTRHGALLLLASWVYGDIIAVVI